MKLHGGAAAVEHGAAQVVVHEVAGGASQRLEGVDVPPQEALQRLVEGEQRGQRARVAEDHDESGDRACAVSDVDLAERAPVDLCLLPDQSHDPAVDGAAGLGPQAPHEAADREDRAGIAALADHLVDPRGAQPRVLRQGVADKRQIRVEDTGPTQAGTDPCRLALHRGADRLTVEAELGRDGPDFPVLAVEQAPDLGALRGCDQPSSLSPRCGARGSIGTSHRLPPCPRVGLAGQEPAGNGKQKRDPRGHVKRDPPVSVNSSVHDLLPWRLFRGCSDLADGLTLAVHIVTCALRSHSRARRVRLSADAPGGVRNRPP